MSIFTDIGNFFSGNAARREAADLQWARSKEAANTQWLRSQAAAQLNRDYQTQMSNTAVQRRVADLKAAGINPMLAAGSAASSPAGNMAAGGMSNAQQATGLKGAAEVIKTLSDAINSGVTAAAKLVK